MQGRKLLIFSGGGNDYNMLFHLTTEKVLALSKQLFGGQLPVAPCPWLRV